MTIKDKREKGDRVDISLLNAEQEENYYLKTKVIELEDKLKKAKERSEIKCKM